MSCSRAKNPKSQNTTPRNHKEVTPGNHKQVIIQIQTSLHYMTQHATRKKYPEQANKSENTTLLTTKHNNKNTQKTKQTSAATNQTKHLTQHPTNPIQHHGFFHLCDRGMLWKPPRVWDPERHNGRVSCSASETLTVSFFLNCLKSSVRLIVVLLICNNLTH